MSLVLDAINIRTFKPFSVGGFICMVSYHKELKQASINRKKVKVDVQINKTPPFY